MSYGGSIINGVWVEADYRYGAEGKDCPDPKCYSCKGFGGYWCDLIGCVDSASRTRSIEYGQALLAERIKYGPHCNTCSCPGKES